MKRWFTLYLLLLSVCADSQVLPVTKLVAVLSSPPGKGDNSITQKGFVLNQRTARSDTQFYHYQYIPRKKNSSDTIQRSLDRFSKGNTSGVIFRTNNLDEFRLLQHEVEGLKNTSPDSVDLSCQFIQKKNLRIRTTTIAGEFPVFQLMITQCDLLQARDIQYAEDLLQFDSHEYLRYTFGAEHVKSDLYYFSEKEFNRCSVLFPNTPRQAVFLWQDETNNCGLRYIIFGGQLNVESAIGYNEVVGQNSWRLKNNIHAGMSLRELRRFHENNFSFYSGNSAYTGMVKPAEGKIDFEQENVVLACLNCTDSKFYESSMMTADEAIAEGRRFFVFSIMLFPRKETHN